MIEQVTVFSNPKSMNAKQPTHITIEELRQCPEFSHLDDSLAQNVINSIQEFCSIIADQYHNLNKATQEVSNIITSLTNPISNKLKHQIT
jgi:hypothetical protein